MLLTKPIVTTFIASAAGGGLFYLLNLPLPWILGPTVSGLACQVLGITVRWPMALRNAGLVVLGAMMGIWFTADTLRQITLHLPGMLLITGTSLLFGFIIAYITARQTGISLSSGLLGSTPGGFSQMMILCDEFDDADLAAVSVLQSIRLLSTVFLVPFIVVHGVAGEAAGAVWTAESVMMAFDERTAIYVLAAVTGAGAARRIKLPTPFLLGPVLAIAMLSIWGFDVPRTPPALSAIAQIGMGAYMGTHIDYNSLRGQQKFVSYAVLGGLLMVVSSLLSAWVLTLFYPVDLATAFLSAAPGGTAEMTITAALIHADVSIVSGYQFFRMLFILLIMPYAFRWYLDRRKLCDKENG